MEEEKECKVKMTVVLDPNKSEDILMMKIDNVLNEALMAKYWEKIVDGVSNEYKKNCLSLFA